MILFSEPFNKLQVLLSALLGKIKWYNFIHGLVPRDLGSYKQKIDTFYPCNKAYI